MRKLLKTNLSKNLIEGINTRPVVIVRYTELFLNCTKEELHEMYLKKKMLMAMHKALHPRNDIGRLSVKKRRKRLINR